VSTLSRSIANTCWFESWAYSNVLPGVVLRLKKMARPSEEKAGSPSSFWNWGLGRSTRGTPSPVPLAW
jgi:hypothetical protein